MDKETLSNYGWIVICVLVLAVMLALASPFGQFVADSFNSAKQGLFDTGDSALDVGLSAVGVSNKLPCGHGRKEAGDHSQKECGHFACEECGCIPASCGVDGHWSEDGLDHTTKVTHTTGAAGYHVYKCQCNGWTIPDGGTYKVGSTVYNSGETTPCGSSPYLGNIYIQGNYEYRYNQGVSFSDSWGNYETQKGWGVHCINDVADPGPILAEINGKPVVNIRYAFYHNTTIKVAPEIPESVLYMEDAFNGCTALETTPQIPSGVTSLDNTFYGCKSLIVAPTIPNNVTDMYYTFKGCTNIKTYVGSADADGDFSNYVIPNGVTDMGHTFDECTSLSSAPVIPNTVTNMEYTFNGCTSLTKAPTIPSSVTSMSATFRNCTSLTTAPIIPSSVTSMQSTFNHCTSLKTYEGSTDPDYDFSRYIVPKGVTNMMYTFYEGPLLTKAPYIPDGVTILGYAFYGTNIKDVVEIPCSRTDRDNLGASYTIRHVVGCDGSCGK